MNNVKQVKIFLTFHYKLMKILLTVFESTNVIYWNCASVPIPLHRLFQTERET